MINDKEAWNGLSVPAVWVKVKHCIKTSNTVTPVGDKPTPIIKTEIYL